MASRSLFDLAERLRPLANQFLLACEAEGIEILVTCTYRSKEEQAALYAKGRTIPGPRVTNAKPGESRHNKVDSDGQPAAEAFDVVPLVHGKAVWSTEGDDGKLWEEIGAIGESLGLEWAGHWTHFKEFPHFQLR